MVKQKLDNKVTVRLPENLNQDFNCLIEEKDFCKSKVIRTLVSRWVDEQRGITND